MMPDDPFGGGGGSGGKTVIRPGGPGGGGGAPQPPRPASPQPGGAWPPPGGQPPRPQQGFPQPGGGFPPPGQGFPPPGQGFPQPGGFPPQQGFSPPGQGFPPPGGNPFGAPGGMPGGTPGGGMPRPGGFNPPGYGQPGMGPGFGGQQQRAPMPGGGQQVGDDWLRGPSAPQFPAQQTAPMPDAPKIPLEVALNARDGGQISSANPITAAAAPLLILLGRLRLMIVDMQAVPLMQHVAQEVQRFEQNCMQAGVDANDANIAKYCLCATSDDIVQNLPGTDKGVWLQYSMVTQFYGVRNSGVGFYEELAKVLHNPTRQYNLLELMHACLSLGFEGQYRGLPNGANELARIRAQVYQTLRHLKSRQDEDISPRWRGLELKMPTLTSRVPIWAIGAAAAAVLLGVFFLLRILLGNDADALSDRLIALHPDTQITLERAAFVPAVIPDTRDQTQLERIRERIGADSDIAGCLNASGVGDEIIISVCNVLLFDSGKATVKPDFADLAAKIAESLQNEPGPIRIIGHTDNVKLSGGGRFKSNFDLSVARAEAVKDVMAPLISDPTRFSVEGRGELDPIADNKTAEGRAQNRRVEIMIPREETLQQNGGGAGVTDISAVPAAN